MGVKICKLQREINGMDHEKIKNTSGLFFRNDIKFFILKETTTKIRMS